MSRGSHSHPYALWDTLPDIRFRLAFFTAPTPNALRRQRAEHRVAPFAAAAAGQSPVAPLAADLARRRERWHEHLNDRKAGRSGDDHSDRWRSVGDFFLLGFDELLGLATLAALAAFVVSAVLAVVLAIPWLIWHLSRVHRRRRCRRALEQSCCPDCEYDLNGAPEPLDRADLGGLNAGPETCPECGVPWPLLPPPVRRR